MRDFQTNGAAPNGRPAETLSHGRAALLLVENLMHDLVEKDIISREDFIDIVEGAAEVEHLQTNGERSSAPDFSKSVLYPLAATFRRELGK